MLEPSSTKSLAVSLLCLVLVSGTIPAQGTGPEWTTKQEESTSSGPRFIFRGEVGKLHVRYEFAWYSCCLQWSPAVDVEGSILRITEADVGPPCLCPVIPWDLDLEISGLEPGTYDIYLYDGAVPEPGLLATAQVDFPATATAVFIRGSLNGDDVVDMADAVYILTFLFAGENEIPCGDVADVNDDGETDLSDAISLLRYLYLGGPEPPPPFEQPGEDPTQDSVICPTENAVETMDFVRNGDTDGNGSIELTDCVQLIGWVYLGTGTICGDAGDVDDDGRLTMADASMICFWWPWLLSPISPSPPAAAADQPCGPDPTPDRLSCSFTSCFE